MAAEVIVHGLGTRTAIQLTGRVDVLEPAVREVWSRCLQPLPGDALDTEPVTVELRDPGVERDPQGPQRSASGSDPARVLQALTQQVTYAKIAARAGHLLMVHAGAVSSASGRTIAFVAPGGTGKTTLTRHLSSRFGFGYLTDETVGVDADLRVWPYPKPLSIRTGRVGEPKVETSPDALGLGTPPPVCTLSRVVLLARSSEFGGDAEVEELTPFEAIEAITPESSSLSALPRPLQFFHDGLLRLDAPTVRLHYREAEAVDALVAGWLEEDA